MCNRVMVDHNQSGRGIDRRCVRQEPHEPIFGCVWETRSQAVERHIRDVLNVPDRHEVVIWLSSHDGPRWEITSVCRDGHPLPPDSWSACANAGLPMVNWSTGPEQKWLAAERASRRHVDVCDRNHGPEQRARRAELEAQRATEKYVSAVETLAEARAMLVKLEPILVAAQALVGTWESGGISHRLGAHLHDLRAAIEGAPVPEKVVWLNRLPTPAEVEAHAKAHPVGFEGGAWINVFEKGIDIVWLHVSRSGVVSSHSDDVPSHCDGDRWRPITAEGDPASIPPVAQ